MRQKFLAVALALLASVGFTAYAQETTSGSIQGTVVDAQGASVPGATVTITSAQGAKTFVTDNAGRFFAPFITPGKVSVRVELTGFSPVEQKNVEVRLGSRLDMSFTLKVGDLQEVVEVVGTAPVVDTTSTTAGGVLDSASLQRLPVGRALTDTLYLVPGVSDSTGLGRSNPSIGGGSGLENNYVIDGVNITDTGFGAIGAYNSSYGSLGSGVTSDFVKETQVKTAGFEAEYGQATGGVVNVVTKSGGNEFTGSVFGYFRPGALESSWDPVVTPNGTVNTAARNEYDFGVSLGGPLVKDKVFFFGTFNPQFQNRSFVAPPGFPFASLGEVERKRKIYSYAAKVTMQASSNHRFDVSVFGDPSKGEAGLQRAGALRRFYYAGNPGTSSIEGGYSEIEYGGHSQTLRYDGIINPNWLVEASVAHASNKFYETPTVDDYVYTDVRRVPNGLSGGLGFWENNDGSNTQFTLKSTHIFEAGGNHQFRYGVAYEDIEFTRDTQYSGAGVRIGDGRTTLTGVPVQIRTGGGSTFYRATRGKLQPTGVTTQNYYNFFAQDTWQIGRLTLRPGIRWERQKLTGPDPADTGVELCFDGDSRPGAGDGTGASFACTYTWDNLWAPRIGATYDIFGNGKSKIYGAWGRFYAKVPNDLAARAMGADSGITRQNYRDAALTQPVSNGTLAFGTTTHMILSSDHAAIIDPEAGSTYKEEIVAGIEFEVANNVSLGVRYIHRTMPQILEDIGELPVAGYFLDQCGDAVVDYFITNPSTATRAINCPGPVAFEDPTHKYDSFEFTLNKTFSNNWGLIASYRYAKLKGNFEGFFRSDNGQSDPAISSLYDFPTNDPTYTSFGRALGFSGDIRYQGTTLGEGILPNDRPHQVKIYGNYTVGNLNLGVGFNWGSGRVMTALASNPAYNNSGEIPMTLRGDGFQTQDGFLDRAPSDTAVDLHADYTFKMGDKQRFVLLADVFNLFNRQEPFDYDNFYETSFATLNPNFGYATNGGGATTAGLQAPMSVRLGARFEF